MKWTQVLFGIQDIPHDKYKPTSRFNYHFNQYTAYGRRNLTLVYSVVAAAILTKAYSAIKKRRKKILEAREAKEESSRT